MFTALETSLISLIDRIPLEFFVFVASFVEEVIAPIPSPTVMMLSGSFAQLQGYFLPGLITLALIGAVGKTIGAIIVYFIADKAEDIVIGKFGAFFGVSREDVESLGKKFGNGSRDYLILTVLRALPIMPSSVVSVGSGILKIPLRLYIISTFLGTILRDGVYLYVGYVGTDMLKSLVDRSSHIESYVELIVGIGVLAALVFLYVKRDKTKKEF